MMKKSILSLSAAVALSGLGFAGSAGAVVFFGDAAQAGDNALPAAGDIALNAGGVGHILYTPYYSAQGDSATLINITNTDNNNGKAVKVRFRGAANSDDVLDFTVYLSPGDVWTASLRQRGDGIGQLKTTDNSCTMPSAAKWPVNLDTRRLDPDLSADVKAINANEGYIEVLNMADIPPGSDLYDNIKHVDGVAPCVSSAFAGVQSTTVLASTEGQTLIDEYGLANPTGGLMGTWAVYNQTDFAVFSGNMGAVVAHNGWSDDNGATPLAAQAQVTFTPQLEGKWSPAAEVEYPVANVTADPLLNYGNALWYDLPDLSTPQVVGVTAVQQADRLSRALSRLDIMNDYATSAADASVPQQTDWVVSQPTRRYHAAINYNTGSLVHNSSFDIYGGLTTRDTDYGVQACHMFDFSSTDREEAEVKSSIDGDFSPGEVTTHPYCGEVFTMSFNGGASILGAKVTNANIDAIGTEGWARLSVPVTTVIGDEGVERIQPRLPMVGFAAISQANKSTNVHYGWTLPHRYDN